MCSRNRGTRSGVPAQRDNGRRQSDSDRIAFGNPYSDSNTYSEWHPLVHSNAKWHDKSHSDSKRYGQSFGDSKRNSKCYRQSFREPERYSKCYGKS